MMEIVCPHCQHVQWESERAVSTNCKACGCYITFKRPRWWKRLRNGETITLETPPPPSTPRIRQTATGNRVDRLGTADSSAAVTEPAAPSPDPGEGVGPEPVAVSPDAPRSPATRADPPRHFAMPESKIRQRLGMGQGAPEAGPDLREVDGPELGQVSNESPHPAPAERQSRSTWLGPEERERRMGRETTPTYPNSAAQDLSEAMPEALSPLQRLKRKVLEQPPPAPPESPVSPLRHMVDQGQDKSADPPTSGAGEDSPDQIAPDAVPASDPASALRGRISVDDAALVRGRERGHFRQGYFRDAVCFECNSSHQVNRSSKATACPQCGARIQLEDIDINSLHEKQVRTRGKVTVQRNGRLTHGPVECQDLVLQGALECDVVCSDQFQVRSDAELAARISCQRFVVDRKVRVRALLPVEADEAEIFGTFEGKLACTGSVVVGPQGHVIGDVTASAIKLESGGVLEGGMTILAGMARDGKTDLSS